MGSPRVRTVERVAFAVVAAALLAAYAYRLGAVPPGLSTDEAADGFNAAAVLHTGADEYGERLPLFFRSFDDYKSPIHVYSIAVSEAVFGMTTFAVRLPSALYAFGAAIGLFFLIRTLTGRPGLARWLGLLALLVPAIFTYGRTAVSEASTLPFYFVLALNAVLAFERRPTWARAFVAGAALGVVTYTYTTTRLLAPLMVAACALVFVRERAARPKLLALLGGAALIAAPMAVWMWFRPHTVDLRFSFLSAWHDHPPASVLAQRIVTNYANHVSFGLLFRTGDPNLRHSIGGVGLLPLWLFAPLLAGLWCLWRQRARPMHRFLLALVFLAPIPVSIADGGINATRMLHFAPLSVAIGALAIAELLERVPVSATARALALVVALGEGGGFVYRYFTEYPGRAQPEFDQGIGEALRLAFGARQGVEPIYAPQNFFTASAIYVRFFGKLDETWRWNRSLDERGIHALDPKAKLPARAIVILPGAAPGTPGELIGRSWRVRDGTPLWSIIRTAPP